MTWRLARSLIALRDEVNAAAPGRSRRSDGSIGDTAHSARASDHNPNDAGVVRAYDFTHDPAGGLDCNTLTEHLRSMGRGGDVRLRDGGYVIWQRRIASEVGGWAWRTYSGSNPHTAHAHVSVSRQAPGYDLTGRWQVRVTGGGSSPTPPAPPTSPGPVLGAPTRPAPAPLTFVERLLAMSDTERDALVADIAAATVSGLMSRKVGGFDQPVEVVLRDTLRGVQQGAHKDDRALAQLGQVLEALGIPDGGLTDEDLARIRTQAVWGKLIDGQPAEVVLRDLARNAALVVAKVDRLLGAGA